MGDIPGHKTDNNLLPFDDIARVLNISSDNARQRFRRCLDTLRKLLQNDEVIKRLF
jgi:DNA-directed RNA polymerase specialized sigma24 family protein